MSRFVGNSDRCSLPAFIFLYIYRPASYGLGKMPDLRREDIVGFHGFPFNPAYLLPNVWWCKFKME